MPDDIKFVGRIDFDCVAINRETSNTKHYITCIALQKPWLEHSETEKRRYMRTVYRNIRDFICDFEESEDNDVA